MQTYYGPFDRSGKGEREVFFEPHYHMPERVRYRFCKTTFQTPLGFQQDDIKRSAKLPEAELSLDFIHGYRGDALASNVFFSGAAGEKLLYFSAGVGIVLHLNNAQAPQRHGEAPSDEPSPLAAVPWQQHFVEHTDDITVICAHPGGELVATGQMGADPHLRVWDIESCEMGAVVGVVPADHGADAAADGADAMRCFYEREASSHHIYVCVARGHVTYVTYVGYACGGTPAQPWGGALCDALPFHRPGGSRPSRPSRPLCDAHQSSSLAFFA